MRDGVITLTAMVSMLSGCQRIADWAHPEAAACRHYILDGLRSPSTYAEASSRIDDRAGDKGKQVRTVTIAYDAANAYGTPVRSTQACDFAFEPSGHIANPKQAAVIANADRVLGKGNSCCMKVAEAIDSSDPLANDALLAGETMPNLTTFDRPVDKKVTH